MQYGGATRDRKHQDAAVGVKRKCLREAGEQHVRRQRGENLVAGGSNAQQQAEEAGTEDERRLIEVAQVGQYSEQTGG